MSESPILAASILFASNHFRSTRLSAPNSSAYALARYTLMTPSRAETSRINGSKSRGPKTEHGRSAVSLNAVKHGLTAETVVLPNESDEQYEAELREYLLHFAPANKPEADLVRQLAAAHWRLARYTRIETSLLDLEMERQRERLTQDWNRIEECGRLALAFEALSGAHSPLALLNRYQARLHHEYQRILKALLQMQATRRPAEARLQVEAKLQNEPEKAAAAGCQAPFDAEITPAPAPAWLADLESGPLCSPPLARVTLEGS